MEESKLYHIFNRGNNKQNIFFSEENKEYFLKQFYKYLADQLCVYAYCLMPNHFHLLIKINENVEIKDVSEGFRKFLMAYSKAINKQEGRTGSLFQKGFKKKEITSQSYYSAIIAYIHLNPVKAGLCKKCSDWKYSSYNAILSEKKSHIKREEVIEWFSGKNVFINFHKFQEERVVDFLSL